MPHHVQQSVILTNSSRLLRKMLNRILLKTHHFDVVQEVSDHRKLPSAIERFDAGWVIMSLPEDNKMPEWVDSYLMKHPFVRFLTVSPDGSQVKIKSMESREEQINDPSLDDLIHVLESDHARYSNPKGELRESPLILKRLENFYKEINNRSGNRIAIIRRSFQTFEKARASQASAGLAYYALFSMFPLLLVLIAGGSYFLNDQQAYNKVIQLVQASVPGSPQWIDENLRQVLNIRGTVGVIGLLTLLWSASVFFTNLAYNINLAWPGKPQRNFLTNRLVGLGMIAGLIGLLLLTLALESFTSLVPFVNIGSASPSDPILWQIISGVGSWLTVFLLFLALYRWIPTARVSWTATLLGALTVSVGWKIAVEGFAWYLRSGLGRYQLVYGSLGAIVALLFLIFILSLITLYGAHLCAAVDNGGQT